MLAEVEASRGQGLPTATFQAIAGFLEDAKPKPVYMQYSSVRFVYEILEKPNWNLEVGRIADTWVQNEANIKRAEKAVGRTLRPRTRAMSGGTTANQSSCHWRPLLSISVKHARPTASESRLYIRPHIIIDRRKHGCLHKSGAYVMVVRYAAITMGSTYYHNFGKVIEELKFATLGAPSAFLYSDSETLHWRTDIIDDDTSSLARRWRRVLAIVMLLRHLQSWSMLINQMSYGQEMVPPHPRSRTERFLNMIAWSTDPGLVLRINQLEEFQGVQRYNGFPDICFTTFFMLSDLKDNMTMAEMRELLLHFVDDPQCLDIYEDNTSNEVFTAFRLPKNPLDLVNIHPRDLLATFYHCLRPDLKSMFCLICALGTQRIPALVFDLALRSQSHWTTQGLRAEIDVPPITDLLRGGNWRDRLYELEPFIIVEYRYGPQENFQISHLFSSVAMDLLSQETRRVWLRIVRDLLLYLVPNIASWSTCCNDMARVLDLRRLFHHVIFLDPVEDNVGPWPRLAGECGIAITSCLPPNRRMLHLKQSWRLYQSDPELLLQAHFERSMALHLLRLFPSSEKALSSILAVATQADRTPLSNAILGHAYALHLQNILAASKDEPLKLPSFDDSSSVLTWLDSTTEVASLAEARARVDVLGLLLSFDGGILDIAFYVGELEEAMEIAKMEEEDDLLHVTRCRLVGKGEGDRVELGLRRSLDTWNETGKNNNIRRQVTAALAEQLAISGEKDAARPFLTQTRALISAVGSIWYDDEVVNDVIDRIKRLLD
ncbi:hypothetical protein KVT40_008497 [Elsinoe batatas]|uniref:Uncharacterized protein n=1 Tax=Elsinoe batatas TaxID=2601811 RepID=A0A8K0PBL1_9PEZI|nr:hypothetical protein KVT40_008497 [Elsinoe batatas]